MLLSETMERRVRGNYRDDMIVTNSAALDAETAALQQEYEKNPDEIDAVNAAAGNVSEGNALLLYLRENGERGQKNDRWALQSPDLRRMRLAMRRDPC